MMENYDLTDILEMGESYNLKLNPKIERRFVNGMWGMYATDSIKSGEVLIASNTPNLIESDNLGDYLAKISAEYELGKNSKLYPWFRSIGELDSYKTNSVYYITDDELETIQSFSPIIAHQIKLYNKKMMSNINILKETHGVEQSTAELVCLLSEARKWDIGFMPVFDLFNHSFRLGNPAYRFSNPELEVSNDAHWVFIARIDYKEGDEIFISYSIKDTLKYAYGFNFYDASDIHMIDITNRLLFKLNDELDSAVFESIKNQYGVIHYDEISAYSITEPHIIIDGAPSYDLIKLVKAFSYNSIEDLNNSIVSYEKFDTMFLDWISSATHKANDDVVQNGIPDDKITPLVERFLLIANKERMLIQKVVDWVIANSNTFSTRFLNQSTQN
jgi:hypothetical protein